MTDKLIKGFEQFCTDTYYGDEALMPKLVNEGQQPDYFIISCIDSRANPGTILRPDPGTFFAFKSMGAIVRPYKQGTALAASLQFAFDYMKVPNLILLGHTQCGAIEALANNIDDPEIASFIDVAQGGLAKAKERVGSDDQEALLREAEKQIVLQSVANVKEYPAVARALAENRLEIHGWVFDMKAAALLEYSEDTKEFEAITNFNIPERCCA